MKIAELWEMDAVFGDPDGPDPKVAAVFEARDLIQIESDRRVREGIQVEDPNEPTLEERWAPYGETWQWEQRMRREEGY